MKHGDSYVTMDGRELLVVDSPGNWCVLVDDIRCHFYGRCNRLNKVTRPCTNLPIIFVDKQEYLTYKLLGTVNSSS